MENLNNREAVRNLNNSINKYLKNGGKITLLAGAFYKVKKGVRVQKKKYQKPDDAPDNFMRIEEFINNVDKVCSAANFYRFIADETANGWNAEVITNGPARFYSEEDLKAAAARYRKRNDMPKNAFTREVLAEKIGISIRTLPYFIANYGEILVIEKRVKGKYIYTDESAAAFIKLARKLRRNRNNEKS